MTDECVCAAVEVFPMFVIKVCWWLLTGQCGGGGDGGDVVVVVVS